MGAFVAVALGGALGALARWGVDEGLPEGSGGWPWATLTANLTGCLLIGVLLAVLPRWFPDRPWVRSFLATGVLGGYTTFSAFTVEGVELVDAGRWPLAVGYVLISVVGGLLAVVTGLLVTRRVGSGRNTALDEVERGRDRS